MHDADHVRVVAEWAKWFRGIGWQPIPSTGRKPDRGFRPSLWWDRRAPASYYNPGCWTSPGIQLMTGVRWGVVVLDLDGPHAPGEWLRLTEGRRLPRTWVVRTPSGGWHAYLSVPNGVVTLPYRRLWGVPNSDGPGWQRGHGIELLGDRRLAACPPTVRPDGDYRWVVGPHQLRRPAEIPDWVLNLCPASFPENPKKSPEYPIALPPRSGRIGSLELPTPDGKEYRFDDVLRAIPDKVGLARDLGLRFASDSPQASGWLPCYRIDRDDRSPSAAFSPDSGRYWTYDESGGRSSGGCVTLFDLAVRLGVFPSKQAALIAWGRRYRAPLRTIQWLPT